MNAIAGAVQSTTNWDEVPAAYLKPARKRASAFKIVLALRCSKLPPHWAEQINRVMERTSVWEESARLNDQRRASGLK
jgi:hypothetical protein